MPDVKRFGRKLWSYLWQSILILLITLLLFEASFRLYLIDFYESDFQHLNADFEKKEENRNLMIIGDSFSAFKGGYTQTLSDSLSQYNIRNISVSGTSIREQYLFGKHHLKKEKPDVLIFQFYVGNDLFSWNHSSVTKEISVPRKVYWKLSEFLWSLNFINYSLRGLKSIDKDHLRSINPINQEFDPQKYTTRDKTYFKAEPRLVENAALLKGGRDTDLISYMEKMKDLFEFTDTDCEIYILVIPHCAQVNELYMERIAQIGAVFSEDFKPGFDEYPLYKEMKAFFSADTRVKVLNPLTYLKGIEDNGIATYLNNDSHLNDSGQQLIGSYLLKELKAESETS